MSRGVLLLLLLAIPVAELFLLIAVGKSIGGGAVFALIVGTGILGVFLLRRARASLGTNLQQAMSFAGGRSAGMADLGMRMAAGAFLLVPGLATDAVGLVLAVPLLRRRIAGIVGARMESRFQTRIDELRTKGVGAMGGFGSMGGPGGFAGFGSIGGFGGMPGGPEGGAPADEVFVDVEAERTSSSPGEPDDRG